MIKNLSQFVHYNRLDFTNLSLGNKLNLHRIKYPHAVQNTIGILRFKKINLE
ncbi:MAG: hypothetical protein JWN76_2902 [Chitinophagaceae bacterium]|nr:hypothetical protein [Chitinophagaceae bacterium]